MAKTPSPVGFSPRYDMQSMMPAIDVTSGTDQLVRPGKKTLMIDALDQRLVDALDQITDFDQIAWRGGKLTTWCFRAHGTPNTKFLVLAYNGLSSETDLRAGMVVRIPRKAALDAALTKAFAYKTNGIGTTVTI